MPSTPLYLRFGYHSPYIGPPPPSLHPLPPILVEDHPSHFRVHICVPEITSSSFFTKFPSPKFGQLLRHYRQESFRNSTMSQKERLYEWFCSSPTLLLDPPIDLAVTRYPPWCVLKFRWVMFGARTGSSRVRLISGTFGG